MYLRKKIAAALMFWAYCPLIFAQSDGAAVRAAFEKAGIPLTAKAQPLRDFSLPLLDGKNINLSDLRGTVVFLNFWATWCPPCRSEMPSMEALYQRFKNRGLAFLAVDIMEDQKEVSAFMNRFKLTFPAALDTDGRVSDACAIEAIPTTFIIRRDGGVIARVTGSRNWNSPAMIAAFEALLSDG